LVKQDKEGHFILIKGAIHQEETTIVNLYAPIVSAPNSKGLKDLKAHIDYKMVVVGDFNTLSSPIDRSSKQNINKETLHLNDTIDQMNLTDTFTIFHPVTAIYTLLSSPWNFLQNRSYLRAQSKPQ
jgi:exonuclease III